MFLSVCLTYLFTNLQSTLNVPYIHINRQVCLESALPTEERLVEAALERKQWLEKHNKKLEKFRAKKDYFGVSTIKNATKPNVVQAVIGCGLLLYSFKLTSTSALGRQYTVTEAALFFDFVKRIMFILNDLTTPELRLAKAETLLSGAETVCWVDCSAEFVGQTVYDFFQRSRNEGASFNFPFPNKVDELWKKEDTKRGLTCVDNEFTLERKQAIFNEALKCIIKKLKKKIATSSAKTAPANNSEMKANRVVFI